MPSEEPRAVDDVGPAGANELDERRILLGRILEIGVLNEHDVAGHLREPGAQRRALAAVLRLQDQREAALALELLQQIARPIARPIIDDDELDAQRHGQHAADDLLDRVNLVVGGHHDRHERVRQRADDAAHFPP